MRKVETFKPTKISVQTVVCSSVGEIRDKDTG